MISLNKISLGALNDTKAYANNQKNIEKKQLDKLTLNEIIQVDFPDNQYIKKQTNKTQIVLHHTVSSQNVDGIINWWATTPERIATAMIVDNLGNMYQNFSTKFWAWHLGIKTAENTPRNMGSIAIEMVSWGGLVEYQNKWYPAIWNKNYKRYTANTKVSPINNVQIYDKPYRGFYGFEKYSDAQIESVRKLLIFWNERFGIPLDYNPTMWEVDRNALAGKPGIWSHTSFRSDKSDCYPDDRLIQMLKSLK
jgi:N-acetyl-anhydromuramyl-L-alanine amidase AmpD